MKINNSKKLSKKFEHHKRIFIFVIWQINILKDVWHNLSLEKSKLKQKRYHYTIITMAKIKKIDHTKCWWRCGCINLSYAVGWNVK